jgi:hypothetical protein
MCFLIALYRMLYAFLGSIETRYKSVGLTISVSGTNLFVFDAFGEDISLLPIKYHG